MIFAAAKDGVTLFVFLTEADIVNIRPGRTLFIDQRQLGGATFQRVILSLHKDTGEILAMLQRAGDKTQVIPEPKPQEGESTCAGCKGIMETWKLLDNQCIVCWREAARKGDDAKQKKGGVVH